MAWRSKRTRKNIGKPYGQARMYRVILGILFALVSAYGWHVNREPASSPSSLTTSRSESIGTTDWAGEVVRVNDGDGVDFRTANGVLKIRLDSVDAPEIGDGKGRPGQPFAQASRDHLAGWLRGRTITARCFETDQYGRAVCALIDQTGASAGEAQVAAGYAWAYTAARGKYLRDAALIDLQAKAEKSKVGLWQQSNPNKPWQWRYDCWQKQQCD